MNVHSVFAGTRPAAATDALAGVRRTPVLTSTRINDELGATLHFKAEHLQHTGSFKFRGASFAVGRLPCDCPGVATHSSGNHGAALAAAAASRGFCAHVVMPDNAVRSKVEAVRSFGGRVHFCAPTQQAREAGLAALVRQGLVAIPPYDHDDIIAGQGSVAVELIDQVPGLDSIVAPIGGGGLLSGITLAASDAGPDVAVVGAEPEGADDAARSLRAGRRVGDHQPVTRADGLRALIGERNFAVLAAAKIPIITVSEAMIVRAMALIWRELRQVVEPSGAVALAAIMTRPERFRSRSVGVVLSGGNLDVAALLEHLPEA